jgi:hypothetical protein
VKSDVKAQMAERPSILRRLALRERAQEHPMIMFAIVVTAAFAWALMRGEPFAPAAAPAKVIDQSSTAKTSRLPIIKVGGACKGQNWGGESAECLKMIAQESGRPDLAVRMIVATAPTDPDTPNIF